jgi:allantoate deiminase
MRIMATGSIGTALGDNIIRRIDQLAGISESEGEITRVFLTKELRAAAELIASWMQDAGMAVRTDAIGNVIGRYEGQTPGLPALLLGSHFDTVRNAGRWDGPFGVVAAIACVAELNTRGKRLPFAIEVVAFSDEEGTRFGATLLGSRALAGTFDNAVLAVRDGGGVSMREAMRQYGLDPGRIGDAAKARGNYLAYLEMHIEQGPVLEAEDLPVGVVTAIGGATRLIITLEGMAGHAGTVPMTMRRDALTGAAECITAIEKQCRDDAGLLGTVGTIRISPGAGNVIPGQAVFSIDMRSASDQHRKDGVASAIKTIDRIAKERNLRLEVEVTHEGPAAPCADWLQAQIGAAIARKGYRTRTMLSGAGHDGMAIAAIADIGMIFVRCRSGISHHPDEHVDAKDVATSAAVLLDVIENFQPRG